MLLMANTVTLSSMMSVAMAMMAAIILTTMIYHTFPPPPDSACSDEDDISSCNRDEDNDCSLTPPSPHGDNHADGDSDGAFFPLPHPSPKQKC